MLKKIRNTLAVLTRGERRRFFRDTFLLFLMTGLDIAFLAVLFFLAGQFIKTDASIFTGMSTGTLLWVAAGTVTLFFLKNTMAYCLLQQQYAFVYGVATRLSAAQMRAYMEGAWFQFTETDSSVHTRKISQLPVEFCQYVLLGWQQLILQTILLFTTVLVLLIYHPFPFLLLFLLLIPAGVFLFYKMRRQTREVRVQSREKSIAALQHLKEALNGFAESNVFGANDFFITRYTRSQQALNQRLAGIQSLQGLPARFMEGFAVLALILLLVFYKNGWLGTVNATGIGIFLAAAYKLIPGLARCIGQYSQVMAYAHTAAELETERMETGHENKPAVAEEIQTIRFENINFAYKDKMILNRFSCEIRAGELTGMQALSGTGKTTVLNILLGFLEPSQGSVYFNETKLNAAQRKQYWPSFSLVKQDGFFLHENLAVNIALSQQDLHTEWMKQVIRICGLDALAGEETDISAHFVSGEGRNISGGQRQRLAIARALYWNTSVLLADEPFNEMDAEAERYFVSYFKNLAAQGKMVLLITHNPESLAACDQIITWHAE